MKTNKKRRASRCRETRRSFRATVVYLLVAAFDRLVGGPQHRRPRLNAVAALDQIEHEKAGLADPEPELALVHDPV